MTQHKTLGQIALNAFIERVDQGLPAWEAVAQAVIEEAERAPMDLRNATIEECAKVCEETWDGPNKLLHAKACAAAIRSLAK